MRYLRLLLILMTWLMAGSVSMAQTEDTRAWTRQKVIHISLPLFTFRLVGDTASAPPQTIGVRAIEIYRGAAVEPFSVIENLEVEAPIDDPFRGFDILDMNFDGYADMRLAEFFTPGPNIPYLHWLFDPKSSTFARRPAFDDIRSPVFDADAKRLKSTWRDGAQRYGVDTYEIINNEPILVRSELKEYREPGVYRLTVSERDGSKMKVIEQKTVCE